MAIAHLSKTTFVVWKATQNTRLSLCGLRLSEYPTALCASRKEWALNRFGFARTMWFVILIQHTSEICMEKILFVLLFINPPAAHTLRNAKQTNITLNSTYICVYIRSHIFFIHYFNRHKRYFWQEATEIDTLRIFLNTFFILSMQYVFTFKPKTRIIPDVCN